MPHFKVMPTFLILKKHLISLFRPQERSIFKVHDPTGTKHLYQLRLGLSQLKSHKKAHNFVDTISDQCLCKIGAEDTDHFLFKCPFYARHRSVLASSVMSIIIPKNLSHLGNSAKLYLYGHHSLTENENKEIIKATIEYIKNTSRFIQIS